MCKNCQGGQENEIELLHVLWLTLDCDCCWGGQVSNGCFCTSSGSTYRYARQTWRPSMDFGTVVLPDAVSNLRPRGVKCRFREPSKGTVTELWLFGKKVNKQKMKEKKQQQKFTGNRAALRTKSPFRPTISAPIMSEGQKNLLLIAVLMSNWQIQATLFCEYTFLQDQAVRQRERRNQVRRRNPERRLTARRKVWSHCSSKDRLWQQKGKKGQRQYHNDIFFWKRKMRVWKKKKFDIDCRKISSYHWFLATKKSEMQSFFLFL